MAEIVKAVKASVGTKDVRGPLGLTAERASKGDLTVRLREALQFGPEWQIARSQGKDGNVDLAATMHDPAQGKAKMTATSMLTPTATDLIVTNDAWQSAPGKGHVHWVKQEPSRAGECTPGEGGVG